MYKEYSTVDKFAADIVLCGIIDYRDVYFAFIGQTSL